MCGRLKSRSREAGVGWEPRALDHWRRRQRGAYMVRSRRGVHMWSGPGEGYICSQVQEKGAWNQGWQDKLRD